MQQTDGRQAARQFKAGVAERKGMSDMLPPKPRISMLPMAEKQPMQQHQQRPEPVQRPTPQMTMQPAPGAASQALDNYRVPNPQNEFSTGFARNPEFDYSAYPAAPTPSPGLFARPVNAQNEFSTGFGPNPEFQGQMPMGIPQAPAAPMPYHDMRNEIASGYGGNPQMLNPYGAVMQKSGNPNAGGY